MMPTMVIREYREFDRHSSNEGRFGSASKEYYDELTEAIKKNGITTPLTFSYGVEDHRLSLGEGNHRLAIAEDLDVRELPVYVHLYRKNSRGKVVSPKRIIAYDTLYNQYNKVSHPKEFNISVNDLDLKSEGGNFNTGGGIDSKGLSLQIGSKEYFAYLKTIKLNKVVCLNDVTIGEEMPFRKGREYNVCPESSGRIAPFIEKSNILESHNGNFYLVDLTTDFELVNKGVPKFENGGGVGCGCGI